MHELIKIGEVARASGCSVETIRHYEKLGLLKPPKRGDNGYRYYTAEAVKQLGFIRHGRDLGLDLHSIHELLNLTAHPDAQCHQVDAIASQHLQRIEARISALQALAQELRTVVTQCRGGRIRECRIVEALFEPQSAPEGNPTSTQQETSDMQQAVLDFWFNELDPKQWWAKDAELDARITQRFKALLSQAAQGELFEWRATPRGRLAEILVLDQFSRNIHRDTPEAFAQDNVALMLAQEAIASGEAETLTPIERNFLYMPYMHSESPKIHQHAERLFRANGLEDNYNFEVKHKAIIDRFGRYPHRNAILGRDSTAEEIEFLKQPGSGF